MKMTATIPSSAAEPVADPAAFLRAVRAGDHVAVPDFDYRAAAALADALAEEELLEEIVSYRKDVTGVDNTIFISPKGSTPRESSWPLIRRIVSIREAKPRPLRFPMGL
jgi:hypothetical protein